MTTLRGPIFNSQEDQWTKSIFNKDGGHYNISSTKGPDKAFEYLKCLFPSGEANDLNFVLFSTSGVHGSYTKLEEIEHSLRTYGLEREFPEGEEPDDYLGFDGVTFVVVQPRLVAMTYGNVRVTLENIEYLKKLRETSWKAMLSIGRDGPSADI